MAILSIMKLLHFLLFMMPFIPVFANDNGNVPTPRSRLMIGMGFGFASRTDYAGWPNYEKYKSFGFRFVPELGWLCGKNFMVGLRYEYNFAKSNFTSYNSIYGGGYFFRKFFPKFKVDKKVKFLSKVLNIDLLPFLEAGHVAYNGYYDDAGFHPSEKKFGAQEISLHVGGRLKLSRKMYFVLYPGYAYNIETRYFFLRNEGGVEFYF